MVILPSLTEIEEAENLIKTERALLDGSWVIDKAIPGDLDALPELVRLASQFEPALRQQFLLAVNSTQQQIDLSDLVAAIRQGRGSYYVDEIMRGLEARLGQQLAPILRQGFLSGAGRGVRGLRQAGIGLSFDLVNPHASAWAGQYVPNLAGNITAAGLQTVQSVLREAVEEGRPVETTARLLRDQVGLTERDAAFARRFERQLVNEGVREEVAEVRVRKVKQSLLLRRARTIARTEIITAHNVGQQGAWKEAVTQGLLSKDKALQRWVVTWDDRLDTVVCEPLDGATCPLGGATWSSKDGTVIRSGLTGPAAHPNCRCALTLDNPS